jgi:hypothetical protein
MAATMAPWDLLDEKDENDLHKHRLLNVEEKPFKRITKRLVAVSTLATNAVAPPPSRPPSSTGDTPTPPPPPPSQHPPPASRTELDALKDDLLLDFAAFESSIARLQFLLDANARERERYQADQERIVAESAAVREHNGALHETLAEARATLAQRRKFDEAAEAITNSRALRPRDEQQAALVKLESECAELERESETYKVTWRERRDQFARIMEEGMSLRRLIRDEKEEVERREGMDEDEDEGGGVGTPREPGVGERGGGGGGGIGLLRDATTPRPAGSMGGHTPLRDGSQPPGGSTLGDDLRPARPASATGSRAPSPSPSPRPTHHGDDDDDRDGDHASPNPHDDDDESSDGEIKEDDVDMYDDTPRAPATLPGITVNAPATAAAADTDRMELDGN